MEFGVGILGESGAAVTDVQPVDIVVADAEADIVQLGATCHMELMTVAGKAVSMLQLEHGLTVDRVYTGSVMTSLDTAGFSITVMRADKTIMQCLDAPTMAPNWPIGADDHLSLAKRPVPLQISHSKRHDKIIASGGGDPEDIQPYHEAYLLVLCLL